MKKCCDDCKCEMEETKHRMCHDFECVCHAEKPRQDTESWEDFDEIWRMLFVDYGTAPITSIKDYGYIRLKDFIKQKKQEWQKLENELVDILYKYCGERGDNEAAVETLQRIIRERETARTQGAEAAVDYVTSNDNLNWFKNMETHSEYEKLLHKAKEV